MYKYNSLGHFFRHCFAGLFPSGHFRRRVRLILLLLLGLPFVSLHAAELKEAKVTQVIKDVKLLPGQAAPRPAAVSDEVRNGTAVRTGVNSRAELTFTDQTLTRLGANTIFSFNEGTRNLQLTSGAILLRVPKDAGGARINTAAVTAAITGTTIMMEYNPNAYIKFIVLEGTGRIFRNDRVGESVLVHAGQMLMVNPKDKNLPDPVDVDVKKLMQTSLLINGFAPLASQDLIAREIAEQTKQKSEGELVATNLAIFGGGTIVSLLDPTHTNVLDQANANELRGSPPPPPPPPVTPPPGKFGALVAITSPNPYVINGSTVISTDPTITTNGVTDYGKIYRGSTIDGPASAWAFGSTSAFDISSGFDNQIGDSGGAAFKFTALQLTGNPAINTTNGQINLGLIAVNGITSGGPGGVLTFAGIRGLLLATVNGSITLGREISFSIAHDLTIYARGENSDLTLGSNIDTGSNVNLYAERDIMARSNITTDQFSAVAGRDISISKANGMSGIQATTMSFNAGNNINIGGAFDTDETAVDSSGDVTFMAGNDIASSRGIHITRTNGGQGDGLNVT
ncbi:MAG: FecR domain-containing protein, partial [Bryobacteraceae bacterium]